MTQEAFLVSTAEGARRDFPRSHTHTLWLAPGTATDKQRPQREAQTIIGCCCCNFSLRFLTAMTEPAWLADVPNKKLGDERHAAPSPTAARLPTTIHVDLAPDCDCPFAHGKTWNGDSNTQNKASGSYSKASTMLMQGARTGRVNQKLQAPWQLRVWNSSEDVIVIVGCRVIRLSTFGYWHWDGVHHFEEGTTKQVCAWFGLVSQSFWCYCPFKWFRHWLL